MYIFACFDNDGVFLLLLQLIAPADGMFGVSLEKGWNTGAVADN